jgi:antitoxin component YwqK of YwqJK toxin-antitoxin module
MTMNRYRIWIFFSFAVLFSAPAHGQEASRDAGSGDAPENNLAKIEPYTGPPIYLPESVQVEATLVGKRVDKEAYGDGKPKIEREIATFSDDRMVNDGFYREYFPNGQVFLEAQYERGTPSGEWKYYHENGQIARTVKYENGKPTGEVEVRRADGNILAKRAYADGKRSGQWTVYNATGDKPLREEHYADGKPDGVWTVWYEDGTPAQESSFRDGKRHGLTTEWGKDGNKRAEVNFADGERDGKSTLWTPDGNTIEQTFRAGKLVSDAAAN